MFIYMQNASMTVTLKILWKCNRKFMPVLNCEIIENVKQEYQCVHVKYCCKSLIPVNLSGDLIEHFAIFSDDL